MLKIGATQTYLDPIHAGINDIQELSKTHEIVSKAKTELWHRLLTHYLPLYFRPLRRQLPERLVPGLFGAVPYTRQHYGPIEGCFHRGGLGNGWQEGFKSPPSGRHLGDSAVIDRLASGDG
jgi:hypothetical protein